MDIIKNYIVAASKRNLGDSIGGMQNIGFPPIEYSHSPRPKRLLLSTKIEIDFIYTMINLPIRYQSFLYLLRSPGNPDSYSISFIDGQTSAINRSDVLDEIIVQSCLNNLSTIYPNNLCNYLVDVAHNSITHLPFGVRPAMWVILD